MIDHVGGEGFRMVQLTPRGLACSIVISKEIISAPGSVDGPQLVAEVEPARDDLVARGIDAPSAAIAACFRQTQEAESNRIQCKL